MYINIELIFDFRITYFGTATLQQLQHSKWKDCSGKKVHKIFGTFIFILYLCRVYKMLRNK